MTVPKNQSTGTLLALLALFLGLFLMMIWPYLVSLLVGALLAVLTRPLYDRLAARRVGPRTAAGLAMAAVLLVLIIPLSFFAVNAIKQAVSLADYLSGERGAVFVRSAITTVTSLKPVHWAVQNKEALQAKGLEFAQSAGGALSRIILVQAAALPELALKVVLAMLAWFFMLFEGDAFFRWLASKVPLEAGLRSRLSESLRATAASTVWATSAAAGAQALVVMAGFLALGVPGVFLAGGATFIFAWIPILGSLPICLAGGIYLYFTGSMVKLFFMGVIAVVAGLSDNVVRPIVMKGHADMHPLLALISIFAGIRMFGILGVIFGPIVAAMVMALLNSWRLAGQE